MIRLTLLLWLLAIPALAQTDPSRLANDAARQLDLAAQNLRDAESSRDRVAALTQTVQAYEAGLEALRDGLRRARDSEAELAARLDASRGRVARVIGSLQAMGRSPESLLLLHPSGPVDTVRAGLLMRDVTPAMLAQVDILRADLERVAALRDLQRRARTDLADGLAGIQQARVALSEAVSDRTDLPVPLAADEDRMSALAASVDTLYAFAAQLPDTPVSVDLPDFADAAGALPLPVIGTVRARFDDADAAGIRRPGWLIDAAPGALVTAPWPATLRYAGPLLNYGNVMILEPAPDHLMVLAGLDTVYGRAGDIVGAGDPLGQLPVADLVSQAESGAGAAAPAGQSPRETLYVELRQGNAPVDPATWFADTER